MCKQKYYFRHDYEAFDDTKLRRLHKEHGMEGIGIFWTLLEKIHKAGGVLLEEDLDVYAFEFRVEEKTIKSIITQFDLFVFEDGKIENKRASEFIEEQNNYKTNRKQFKSNTNKRGAPKGNRNTCKQKSCVGKDENKENNSETNQINSETNKTTYNIEYRIKNIDSIESSLHSDSCSLGDDAPSEPKPTKKKKEVDFEAVLAQWAEHCPRLSQPRTLNDRRKHKIALRLDEMSREDIKLSDVLQRVGQSNFLNGESGSWRASFDWLFDNDSNWRKVVEGNYDNRGQTISAPRGRESVGVPMEIDADKAKDYVARFHRLE